jgi:protein-histidine pros-kinase
VVLANKQAQFLFGLSVMQLIGTAVEDLMPERFRGEHPGYRRRYLENPHPRPMGDGGTGLQLAVRRSDGNETAVTISLNAFITEDGQQYVTTIIRRLSDHAAG